MKIRCSFSEGRFICAIGQAWHLLFCTCTNLNGTQESLLTYCLSLVITLGLGTEMGHVNRSAGHVASIYLDTFGTLCRKSAPKSSQLPCVVKVIHFMAVGACLAC